MRLILSLLSLILISQINYSQDSLTWYWQNPLPQGNYYRDVAIVNHDLIYACGNNGTIVRTQDGGLNWDAQFLMGGPRGAYGIEFFNENIGIAACDSSIYRTVDGGNTWYKAYHSESFYLEDIVKTSDTSAYVVAPQNFKIYFTNDLGYSWQSIGVPWVQDGVITHLSFMDDNQGWVVVFGEEWGGMGAMYYYLFSTENGGVSWEPANMGFGLVDVDDIERTSISVGWKAAGGWLRKSNNNGGLPWTTVFEYDGDASLDFSDEDHYFLTTYNYSNKKFEIWQSTDQGVIWELIETGFDFRHQTYFGDTNFWVRIKDNRLYSTLDAGQEWQELSSGFVDDLEGIYFLNKNLGWTWGYANQQLNIYRSTNGGYNWDNIFSMTSDSTVGSWGITLDPQFLDSTHMWGILHIDTDPVARQLVKSNDGGYHWENVAYPEGFSINCFYAESYDTLWLAGDQGKVFLSFNGGGNWIDRSVESNYQKTFSILPYSETQLWISGSKGIYFSTDMGINWDKQYSGSFNQGLGDLNFFSDDYGIAGSNFNIYYTYNGGLNWYEGSDIFPIIYRLQCMDSEHFYYMGYKEIYKSSNSGLDWIEISSFSFYINSFYFLDSLTGWVVGDKGIIQHTRPKPPPPNFLSENPHRNKALKLFPNPSNHKLNIDYSGVQNNSFDIKIYDMGGRLMYAERIVNGTGHLIHQISVENLTKGIYIVSLEEDGTTYSGKFIKD